MCILKLDAPPVGLDANPGGPPLGAPTEGYPEGSPPPDPPPSALELGNGAWG